MHITLALWLSTRRTAVITKTEARALGGTGAGTGSGSASGSGAGAGAAAATGAATASVSFLALAPIQIGPSILFEKLFAYNKTGTKRNNYILLVSALAFVFS